MRCYPVSRPTPARPHRSSWRSGLLVRDAAYAEIGFGHWDQAIALTERATQLDPRNLGTATDLGWQYLYLRRYAEARTVLDRVLAAAPERLDVRQFRAKVDLAQGDLPAARVIIRNGAAAVDTATLVVLLAESHIAWALDSAQGRVLRSLPPSAFDNDRGIWGLVLAQEYALRGDRMRARAYADSARVAYEAHLRVTPNDANLHAQHGVALAYLGRRDEAVAEGKRGVALVPMSTDAFSGPAYLHQLARIYILAGEPEQTRPVGTAAQAALLSLAGLASDRPQLRSAAREPALRADHRAAVVASRSDS
jgi:tetratricopeptide (TPR) repeat protein